MTFQIPRSLKAEHDELHAELARRGNASMNITLTLSVDASLIPRLARRPTGLHRQPGSRGARLRSRMFSVPMKSSAPIS